MLAENINAFLEQIPENKRLLGLDVGEKTIGLALSDGLRNIASPLHTITRKKFTADVKALLDTCAEHEVCGLIIGLPLNMDGSVSARSQSVKQFAHNVAKQSPLPILLWDERFSTQGVMHAIKEADLSRQRRDAVVDKLAASYILQGFLDTLRGTSL